MGKSGKDVLIFGGTTEGRLAAERLLAEGVPCTVCVATQYGEEVMTPHPLLSVHVGRLDRCAMEQQMQEGSFCCVIDATHPYAQAVSQEIRSACARTGLPCLRLQRDTSAESDPAVFVRDVKEAGAFLASVPGRILVTTGSKELGKFVKALGDPSRVTARVLPAPDSILACTDAGLAGKQIFAMQGPFDTEMNCALIHHVQAQWLLTKETGSAGGYPQKLEAVRKCGIGAVVIRTPSPDGKTGREHQHLREMDLEETVAAALRLAAAGASLSLIGIGVGAPEAMTIEARDAIARAEVVFGAESVLQSGVLQQVLSHRPEGCGSDGSSADFGEKKTAGSAACEPAPATGKTLVPVYDSEKIVDYLEAHPKICHAAVLYSGDSGFYSGASSMLSFLRKKYNDGLPEEERWLGTEGDICLSRPVTLRTGTGPEVRTDTGTGTKTGTDTEIGTKTEAGTDTGTGTKTETGTVRGTGTRTETGTKTETGTDTGTGIRTETGNGKVWDIRVFCGISSPSWFASRLGVPWQDWKILSSHGRSCNVIGHVRRNRRCFLLLSGAEDLRRTGDLLFRAQEEGILGLLQLYYGYELSRPQEEIRECTPYELREVTKEGLYVLLIENCFWQEMPVLPGLPDEAFLRGRAPMTSAEIRALALCKLGPGPKPLLWDVGAGTGSVSVEAALACPGGRVFSIEYKKEALALLEKNRDRFCLRNMEIVEGHAPEVLDRLPPPTHVFIGGSGGRIREILSRVFRRNPGARVVATCITSETLAALQAAMEAFRVTAAECIQVSVNREEKLGRYHYLRGANPVFIISFTGNGSGQYADYLAGREN